MSNGSTPANIAELAPGAMVTNNLAVSGDSVSVSLGRVDEWYQSLMDD